MPSITAAAIEMKYILLDSNVTAAYYLPRSCRSKHVCERIENIFDSARSGESEFFFYLPNFCVAEVFSVFMKYTFGKWNSHIKSIGTLDTRVYKSLVKQFESDIHNGKFIYHYELARYHVLAINLVAPIDHHFQISRRKKVVHTKKKRALRKVKSPRPAGTFDHLIIAMGIHLARIHGSENVTVVSADSRLIEVLAKCKSKIPKRTIEKLKLDNAESLTGIPFVPASFPKHVDLVHATNSQLEMALGSWPLKIASKPHVYRWLT